MSYHGWDDDARFAGLVECTRCGQGCDVPDDRGWCDACCQAEADALELARGVELERAEAAE